MSTASYGVHSLNRGLSENFGKCTSLKVGGIGVVVVDVVVVEVVVVLVVVELGL